MALLQDIIGSLTDMGFQTGTGGSWGGDYMGIQNITPSDISSTLQSYFGLGSQDLPAHMFQGISSDILRSGLSSTYSPQVQAGGQSLLTDLQKTMYGKEGRTAAGGFAGSAQQRRFTQGAKDVYGKGMSDVLAQTGQQQVQGLQNVQDIMNQWRDTALQLKGLG